MKSASFLHWAKLRSWSCAASLALVVGGTADSIRAQELETPLIDKFDTIPVEPKARAKREIGTETLLPSELRDQAVPKKPAGPRALSPDDGIVRPSEIQEPTPEPRGLMRQASTSVEFLPLRSAYEQKIVDALNTPTEVTLRDNDLTTAIDFLKEQHGIEIWIDEAQVSPNDIKVTLETSNASLRSVLNLLLESNGLAYIVEDDSLKVTTRAVADAKLITRIYPVGDLIDNNEDAQELRELLECGLGLGVDGMHPQAYPMAVLGSPPQRHGPLVISAKSRVVVLRQTHEVHDELLQILRNLRQNGKDEITLPVY
jgi:hypothetical protein